MSLTVADRAQKIANFRYVAVRLMEITAGWTPTTPEMEVKIVFGRHIWDFAQHADSLGKRTFELRQREQYSLAPAKAYVDLLDEVSRLDPTADRLHALYDILLSGLDQSYDAYLAETDHVLDEPSLVIIDRIRRDVTRMRQEGDAVRRRLKIAAAELGDLRHRHEQMVPILSAR